MSPFFFLPSFAEMIDSYLSFRIALVGRWIPIRPYHLPRLRKYIVESNEYNLIALRDRDSGKKYTVQSHMLEPKVKVGMTIRVEKDGGFFRLIDDGFPPLRKGQKKRVHVNF